MVAARIAIWKKKLVHINYEKNKNNKILKA